MTETTKNQKAQKIKTTKAEEKEKNIAPKFLVFVFQVGKFEVSGSSEFIIIYLSMFLRNSFGNL